jgi:hypothetical protein
MCAGDDWLAHQEHQDRSMGTFPRLVIALHSLRAEIMDSFPLRVVSERFEIKQRCAWVEPENFCSEWLIRVIGEREAKLKDY